MRGSPFLPLATNGCWSEILAAEIAGRARPALFLDRDGVVVAESGYLRRVEDLAVTAGAAAAIVEARAAGWWVVLVTNQSGIARGLLDWQTFAEVQAALLARLAEKGARFDMVVACPFLGVHPWRKPAPGMLLEAARRLPIDLCASVMVGDKADDLHAARAAGLTRAAHVLTGHGTAERHEAAALAGDGFQVLLWESVAEAVSLFPAQR